MNDFTKEEILEIIEWGEAFDDRHIDERNEELFGRFTARLAELVELENMDLADCAGGACKL